MCKINKPLIIPILIIFRILLGIIISLEIFQPITAWLANTIELLMYMITASLFILGKNNLKASNIDKASLYMFILFGGLLRYPISNDEIIQCTFFQIIFFILSMLLLLQLRSYKPTFKPTNIREDSYWVSVGVLCGIVLSIIAATPYILENQINNQSTQILSRANLSMIIPFLISLVYALGHSAILEEPIYRGFIWGYLRELEINEKMILILQTVLFWLAHIRYFNEPFTFWIVLPVSGLLFGWLALRSKSIAPSMLAHSIFNAMAILY